MRETVSPQQCAPGIWRVILPMHTGFMTAVNSYVVEDEHGITLVDSGLGNDETWECLNSALVELRLPLRYVNRVLLSHAHPDHSGLAGRIAETTGATVWVHQRDLEFIDRRYIHGEIFQHDLRRWLAAHGTPEEEAAELSIVAESTARAARQLPQGETYREGEHIQVGPYDFAVEWTPGHTPGHVCLSDEAHGLLFCGDHVLPNVSPNVGMQPDSEVNPLPGYLASLAALAQSDVQVTLPGHGETFPIQGRAHQLRQHQLSRQRRLLDLLEDGPHTAYGLAGRVWAHAKPLNWPRFHGNLRRNAVNTLIAHLELLCTDGRVERSEERPYHYALS
jgi:glyoxylase-like metal-dependent hydrolase (beta-lactamase superfamily II)